MKDKICPVCNRVVDTLRSGIKGKEYLSDRCDRCFANYSHIASYARKYNRDRGRQDYRKDIIQRFEGTEINDEFVKAYPEQSAKDWGNEILRGVDSKRKLY